MAVNPKTLDFSALSEFLVATDSRMRRYIVNKPARSGLLPCWLRRIAAAETPVSPNRSFTVRAAIPQDPVVPRSRWNRPGRKIAPSNDAARHRERIAFAIKRHSHPHWSHRRCERR
jgi:hypothetical protein